MLRPAKLFHSLHQIRHYVQTKVTELVVQHPPAPFMISHTALTHGTTKTLTNGLERQVPLMNKPSHLFSRRPTSCLGLWHRGITPPGGRIGAFRSYSSATTRPFVQASSSIYSPSASVLNYVSSGIFAHTHVTTLPPKQQQQQQQQQQQMDPIDKHNTHPLLKNQCILSDKKTTVSTELFCKEDDLTEKISSTLITYYYITLDLAPSMTLFNTTSSNWKPWTREVLPILMDWKIRQQTYYDQLLEWLQRCLDQGYQLQQVGSSLRLYLPKHVMERSQALAWLDKLKTTTTEFSDWQLGQETVSVDESLVPLGPDYFQGIHLFLSHIDDLVDHGPAFAQSSM